VAVAVCAVCVDVSLSRIDIGAEGGSAIARALPHLTSLTTLEYVRREGGVCDVTVMQRVVGVPVHEWQ
jgi:hypothetical protein